MTNFSRIWNFDLIPTTEEPRYDASCIMQAVSWVSTGHFWNDPDNVCPIVRAQAVAINDSFPARERQQLRDFIPDMINTIDPEARPKRYKHLCLQNLRLYARKPRAGHQWAWPWHDNGEVVGHGLVMFRRLLFGVLLAVSAQAASASATEECHAVHFKPGTSSITLRGTALPDQAICYTFATSAGQTADLRITGRNMILSVDGVGDAREAFTFKTKRQTYRFIVGQLMRSVTPEAYAVTLSVK